MESDGNQTSAALAGMLTAMGTVIIFGNTLTVLAFVTSRQIRQSFQSQGSAYVVNLAVADLVVGLSVMLQALLFFPDTRAFMDSHRTPCLIHIALFTLGALGSLMTLEIVAVDRLLYIGYPFLYQQHVTERTMSINLVFSWLIPSVITGVLVSIYDFETVKCKPMKAYTSRQLGLGVPSATFAMLVVIIACYIRIIIIARRQQKTVSAEVASVTAVNSRPAEKTTAGFFHSCSKFCSRKNRPEKPSAENLPEDSETIATGESTVSKELQMQTVQYTCGQQVQNSALDSRHSDRHGKKSLGADESCKGTRPQLERQAQVKDPLSTAAAQILCEPSTAACCNDRKPKDQSRTASLDDLSSSYHHGEELSTLSKSVTDDTMCSRTTSRSQFTTPQQQKTPQNNLQPAPKMSREKQNKKMKSVVLFFIVNGLFFLCWLPTVVRIVLLSFDLDNRDIVTGVTSLLAITNSALNVFVYAWKSVEYREAYIRLLKWFKC